MNAKERKVLISTEVQEGFSGGKGDTTSDIGLVIENEKWERLWNDKDRLQSN